MKSWKLFTKIFQLTIGCLVVLAVYKGSVTLIALFSPKANHTQKTPPRTNDAVLGASTTTQVNSLESLAYKVPVTFDKGFSVNDTAYFNKDVIIKGGTLDLSGATVIGLHFPNEMSQKDEIPIEKEAPQTISTTGVLSLQGQTGNITLQAGSGLSLATDDTTKTITINQSLLANTIPDTLVYANGTSLLSLPIGTTGYMLQSNGTNAPPSWENPTTLQTASLSFANITSGTSTTSAFLVGNNSSITATGSGIINATQLLGGTWATPQGIGTTIPNLGNFTNLNTTTLNGLTITPNGTNTLNIAQGKSFVTNNSVTLNGIDNTTLTFQGSDVYVGRNTTDILQNKTIAANVNTITGLTNDNLSGNAQITNANLATPSIAVITGAGLSGGGTIALGGILNLTNTGVLSLPQSITATASPTFAGLTVNGTLYAQNIVSTATSGQNGFWQLNNGALSPANLTNDFLLGGISTSSAKFGFINLAGGTPTATIAGNFSLKVPTGTGSAQTINMLNGGNLGFYTSPGGDTGLNANPALYIANNGNLGIGTNNPGTNKLQINGGPLYVNGNTITADGYIRSNNLFWLSNGSTGIPTVLRLENFSNSSAATGIALNAKFTGTDSIGTEWTYQNILKDQVWSGTATTRNATITFNTLLNNTSKEVLRLAANGTIGIGSTSPLATLDIRAQSGTVAIASISGKTANAGLVIDNSGGDLFTASNSGQTKFVVDKNGNTKIFGGSLCVKANNTLPCGAGVAGNIYASSSTIGSADVAENYVSAQTLHPGDLVIPANDGNNMAVVKTTKSYQQQLIGVVSTQPGVTLNSDAAIDKLHKNLYPIAMNGRVPMQVSNENGPIQVGDYLTSSSTPGVAMKAVAEGTVIGKALENFDGTTGKILVYVTVSWANPSVYLTAQTNNPPLYPYEQIGTNLPQLQNKFASVSGTLSVSGRTILNDLGVTGIINTGLLSINGLDTATGTTSATMNTLGGPLKLQSFATAGLDFENGKITINTNGDMMVNATITAKTIHADKYEATDTGDNVSVGEAAITAGQTTTEIKTTAVTSKSKIFVTAESPIETPLFVSKKTPGLSFTVSLTKPPTENIWFNWWIVN